MGWWKINDGGQMDWEHDTDSNLINAIPGKHTPENHYSGDEPADIMDQALEDIVKLYEKTWGRRPYPEELQAAWDFCYGGLIGEWEDEAK